MTTSSKLSKVQVEALQKFQDDADLCVDWSLPSAGWLYPPAHNIQQKTIDELLERGMVEEQQSAHGILSYRISDEGRYALATLKEYQRG